MSYKVSVVIPTRGDRPDGLLRCVQSLRDTAPDVEILVVYDGDVAGEDEPIGVMCLMLPDAPGAIECWNQGAAHASGDAFVLGADDIVFQPGWYEEAMSKLVQMNMVGLVALNDMSPNAGKLATHYLVSKNYLVNEWNGCLAIPAYEHYFVDTEATYRAQRDQMFSYAENAKVEHNHHLWGKAPEDETYKKGMSTFIEGRETYEERKQEGFPNDWEPYFSHVESQESGWGRVAVGSRVYRAVMPEFHNSWSFMLTTGLENGDSLLSSPINKPAHLAANTLVRGLLNSQCNSILLVDDDMQFASDSLRKLRNNKANWSYDVVMGFCTHKTIPPHAVVLKLLPEPDPPFNMKGEHYGAVREIPDNSVIDVDAVGLAFTLIKRHVFEAMVNEFGARHSPFFEWGRFEEGEDIVFSRWCRENGFKLAVDTSVKIGHVGTYTHGWQSFHDYLEQVGN